MNARGIWYDAPNRRWRVRRYKNRKAYLVGYFPTREEAERAHAELLNRLDVIPKQKRGERVAARAPATTFLSFARAALSEAI